MKATHMRFILIFAAIAVLAAACRGKNHMAGEYAAFHPDKDGVEVRLVLKADGRGSWEFEGEEALFKWELRNREIWLHTRAGGLIMGNLIANAIHITLPGVGEFEFKKQ